MSSEKRPSLIALDANPCKMCMPMGVVNAAYGIKGNMVILHGSQGCATYIRRHMATHYNEPIDIASSALTEQGTVYGGEKNLKKGIDNFVRLYNPAMVTVATTCLAETIGEDTERIIAAWHDEHPELALHLVPVRSPGYGGSQFEGHFRFLTALLQSLNLDPAPNERVNIVLGPMSPADVRFVKQFVLELGIDAIILPDISLSLDGQHNPEYSRVHEGGTPLDDIRQMAGARQTIELASFISDDLSVGHLLEQRFGVPCTQLNLPMGLRDTDAFIEALMPFSTGSLCERILLARGRFLDAMIDSHKHNAEGRAVLFGEPDFVYALARSCVEQGIMPVVVACSTRCRELDARLRPELNALAERLMVEDFSIIDEADFTQIEALALEHEANVMIGSSDGRRIEQRLGIGLVRAAFPVHDHVGGQRIRTLGYEGGLDLIDRITNTLVQAKETGFRQTIKDEFLVKPAPVLPRPRKAKHPCFSESCSATQVRIHLPVAPACNIQCNYCVRKYDCPNESRPGVTTKVLSPAEALERYLTAKERMGRIAVVGIAGPGDSLANFEAVQATLELVRAVDPELDFCISTNGLLLPNYAEDLVRLGVSHVTVTMNFVSPAVGAQIVSHVKLDGTDYTGEAAAALLLSAQIQGICALVSLGVLVKVNTVFIKGVNDSEVLTVARLAKALGADLQNVMQLIPVEGSAFASIPQVDMPTLRTTRMQCSEYLRQMYNCQQCRADAAGLLHEDMSYLLAETHQSSIDPWENGTATEAENQRMGPALVVDASTGAAASASTGAAASASATTKTPFLVAVASKSGMVVDQHFGHVQSFSIYQTDGNRARYIEDRQVARYCTDIGECGDSEKERERAATIALLSDCAAICVLRIGYTPETTLAAQGIIAVETCERIEDAVAQAYRTVLQKRNKLAMLSS